jgi:hypothetical protein
MYASYYCEHLIIVLMYDVSYNCKPCSIVVVVVVAMYISHERELTSSLVFNNFARKKKLWLTFALQIVGIL